MIYFWILHHSILLITKKEKKSKKKKEKKLSVSFLPVDFFRVKHLFSHHIAIKCPVKT